MTVVDLRRPTGGPRRVPKPFTVEHFRLYAARLVYDDGVQRDPESWQVDFVRDVFRGYPDDGLGPRKGGKHDIECLLLIPEGNGKTTVVAILALYGADWAERPWIPVGASTRDQARVLYQQAKGFVENTPGMGHRFRCFDGYRAIRPLVTPAMVESGRYPAEKLGKRRPGEGITIQPWDPSANDGAIPYPFYICDELHRHGDDTGDLTLWRLWKGKCKKRGAQGIGISTAGEPGQEFEELRDTVRQRAVTVQRRHGGTHYRGGRAVMFEFRAPEDAVIEDPRVNGELVPERVEALAKLAKGCNPLSQNSLDGFRQDLESPSLDLGSFKRLKLNVAARSSAAAITDAEWLGAAAQEYDRIPDGERRTLGLDVGWKHDTTAITPIWRAQPMEGWPRGFLLVDEALVEVPPRDGTMLHPDRVKARLIAVQELGPIDAVVMDTSDAADLAAWIEDELNVSIVDRQQTNDLHVLDYKNVMRGLRNCQPSVYPLAKARGDEAKHDLPLRRVTRCPLLTRHAMNAVGRRLPRGAVRFDRPSEARTTNKQNVRVVDALTAMGMATTHLVATAEPDVTPLVAMVGR